MYTDCVHIIKSEMSLLTIVDMPKSTQKEWYTDVHVHIPQLYPSVGMALINGLYHLHVHVHVH